MKKLKNSLTAKIIALVLFCALSVTLVFSAAASMLLESWGAYDTESYEEIQINSIEDVAWNYLYSAWDMYMNGVNPQNIHSQTNFRFAVFDAEGKELYSNKSNDKVMYRIITTMQPYSVEYSDGRAGSQEVMLTVVNLFSLEAAQVKAGAEFEKWKAENSYEVMGYVMEDMVYQDKISERLELLDMLIPFYYALLFIAAGSAILLILLLAFFISAAGHKKAQEDIYTGFVDKIPLDVFIVLATASIFMPFSIASEMRLSWNFAGYIVVALVTVWTAASVLVCLMSIAVRIKSKTLCKNCLCVKAAKWIIKIFKTGIYFAREALQSMPAGKRWAVYLSAAILAEVFLILLSLSAAAPGMVLIFWFINLLLTIFLILWCSNCFVRLRRGAKELASGSLVCSIDTRYMRGELLEHAKDLMNIHEGMSRAVEQRMKSERFQSELITNVSHDIKTPLTSIVNYVDLLQKEEIENEKAREYISVLSRQAEKLKKLIGDLIEASKASTGVLAVNPERCELGVLLEQCAGEYKERLENAGLRLVVTKPEKAVPVMADGRHMWRILDNLMGNVLKYAQSGTRVYLSLEKSGEKAKITLKNISRDEINLDGEELMVRFVRGDSARSGEGSGLGLAIAKSLTELQGGQMSISVDGDLFKVNLTFNITE